MTKTYTDRTKEIKYIHFTLKDLTEEKFLLAVQKKIKFNL